MISASNEMFPRSQEKPSSNFSRIPHPPLSSHSILLSCQRILTATTPFDQPNPSSCTTLFTLFDYYRFANGVGCISDG